MKKFMKAVFVLILVCVVLVSRQTHKVWIKIKKMNKKINWQALTLSLMFFWILGYGLSTVIAEIASGIQIEDISRNSGWGMFHLVLVGLSTLVARKVYKWLEHEK